MAINAEDLKKFKQYEYFTNLKPKKDPGISDWAGVPGWARWAPRAEGLVCERSDTTGVVSARQSGPEDLHNGIV